ncbi:MAG: O-antigen ligase family protein [Prevotellaceae bacterium]|jgi:O-antigen ligase|nr:O-antigen ligase family protein [Prevotellaceae bacterium]
MMRSFSIQALPTIFAALLLCAGTLFASSAAFVDAQVAPKWYCFAFGALALLVALAARFFFPPKAQQPGGSLLRWVGAAAAAACTAQALYGVLQYAGALPAANGFRVTGSFDNPAGFAASLCAAFPLLLYFAFGKSPWQRGLGWAAAGVVAPAVALSASRAGALSLAAVGAAAALYKLPRLRRYKVPVLLLCLLLPVGLYLLKKDSADGRLLIWRCSWEMVKDKPLLGHGHGGFKASYMSYQATFFEEHPDSRYAMLADNVNRPFNEYVLLLTDYGVAGLALLLAAVYFLWKSFLRCRREKMARVAGCCLLSVGVFAFFSYPLRYPFVWIMLSWSVAVIIYRAKYPVKIPRAAAYPAALLTILASILLGGVAYRRMADEMLWCSVAHQSLAGKTKQMMPTYDSLYKSLAKNELFLYNYAAELNVADDYGKSLQVARECENLWADYDLQMLMADSYEKLNQREAAEGHYRKAAAMCPVKFMPLYRLAKLHAAAGRRSEALALAKIIVGKKVKIPSYAVAAIKREMQQLVEREENLTPAAQNEASKPPNTQPTRQGEAPAVQPRGSALPP